MNRTYGEPKVTVDPESRIVTIGLDSGVRNGQVLGSQIYDPDTATFICEGDWKRVNGTPAEIAVKLPAEKGHYHAYVSPVDPDVEERTEQEAEPALLPRLLVDLTAFLVAHRQRRSLRQALAHLKE